MENLYALIEFNVSKDVEIVHVSTLRGVNGVIVDFSVPYSSGHITAVKYDKHVGQAANSNKPVCLLRNQLHICRKYNFLIRITTQHLHLQDVNNRNE